MEGMGHAVSLLITVVRGRCRPLRRPNFRRRSPSSAFFNTPSLSSYGDGDDDGGGGGSQQRNSAGGPM